MMDMQMARAELVQTKYTDMLLNKPHVVGVGLGIAQKAGAATGEVALVVMVDHKLPPHELEPDERIPAELDGVRVDVQEVGQFTAF